VQGGTPKDGKIHSLESLEGFKAEKKEPSKTEKSVTSVLSVTATFEDEKQTSNITSISQKPNVHSILDVKSNEDIKSIKPDSFIIVGEPAFDGNCELCGETGVNVVFRFEGFPEQHYAHKVCLENREALERFYRLVFKKMEKTGETAEKRLELGEKVKAAYELYHRLLEPALNMVEEEVFIKALRDIDREPERLLDHLKKHGMIFAPREGWIRWIK